VIHLSAETWNKYYPPGTRVLYEPVRDRGDYYERITRGVAYETQNGPMVQLVGAAGGFLLRHLAPIGGPQVRYLTRDEALARTLDLLCAAPDSACAASLRRGPLDFFASSFVRGLDGPEALDAVCVYFVVAAGGKVAAT
jgi:hypothetical protein